MYMKISDIMVSFYIFADSKVIRTSFFVYRLSIQIND